MASYNKIRLLAQLSATDPADTEDASKMAAESRQLRDFLKNFLAVTLNDDGTLSAEAVGSDVIAEGAIRGSTTNVNGEQREIQQGSISTADFRASAVNPAAIANDAVETLKIKNANVTAAKLATDSVETAKIKDLNVTSAKIAAGAVTADKLSADAISAVKITNLTITNNKLAASSVSLDKFATVAANKVLTGNGSGVTAATVGGVLTATLVDDELVFALTSGGVSGVANFARVLQKVSSGTSGGSATGNAYDVRAGYTLDQGTACSIVSNRLHFAIAGTYLIRACAVAYSVGQHRIKVVQYDASTPVDLLHGTAASAPAGVQTMSIAEGLVVLPAAASLHIAHWTQFAKATNGFGMPVTTGAEEVYITIEVLRVA